MDTQGTTNGDVVSKWRRGTADLKPVMVDGDLKMRHVDEMLKLAFDYGIANIFAKPGRHVLGGPGEEYLKLSNRRMTNRDIEDFASIIWTGGNPVNEMLQGKPLDFRYNLRLDNGDYVFYRGSMKQVDGVGENNFSIAIRPLAGEPPEWEKMEIEDAITANILPDAGLVAFVGKTDSGKTTLQSSAIHFIGRTTNRTQKVEEYGMPIEYLQDDTNWPRMFYVPTNVGTNIRPDKDWRGGPMSFACKNAMRCGPTIVAISECRDDYDFRAIVEVTLTGHTGFTTMHTKGPADTVGRMCLAAPPDQRDGFASEILAAMHMVIHQRLIPAKSGGRIGVREFLVFTPEIKSVLSRLPYKDLGDGIHKVMMDADGKFGQRFDQALPRLLEADLITKAVFDERMSGLQKVGTL
jgi:defect-in-organelle-trafficking protein DotB